MTYRFHKPQSRRPRVWLILGLLFGGATLAAMSGIRSHAAAASDATSFPSSIMINEIKSGGTNTSPGEYVTIYNGLDKDVVLDGWTVEFAKQAFPAASCAAGIWKNASSNVNTVTLKGMLAAHSISQPFTVSINNDVPGSVHLTDATGAVLDTVGWGSDSSKASCFESAQAANLPSGKSLQRYLGCVSSLPIDTDNNADDFLLSATPAPGKAGSVKAPQCTPPAPVPTPVPTPTPASVPSTVPPTAPPPSPSATPTPNPAPAPGMGGGTPDASDVLSCEGVTISEILPNPSSTDTGHEFIELRNATNETIALDGCSLQTSASSSKTYKFTNISLQPGEYHAFYDSTTGLTLPNASGGTVWLLSPAAELHSVTYGANPEDDTSWTNADGLWNYSYTPTPNAPNLLTITKPCPDGQVRNTETNRCVTATTAETQTNDPAVSTSSNASATGSTGSLTPCATGQERNPDTNRCRKIASDSTATATSLTPCKAGQERNPDTNRCRNATTTAATTETKACPTGQERNPDTNRCRKISGSGTTTGNNGGSDSKLAGVKDIASSPLKHANPYWVVAAALLLGGIGYAVYEWRQEISLFFRSRFGRNQAGTVPAQA